MDYAKWLEERRPADSKVDVSELIKMRNSGKTQSECCKKFGVHQRVIQRILDANNLPRFIPSQIIGTCPVCKKEFKKSRNSQRTCSKECGIMLLVNPAVNDIDIAKMYLSMMTQQEIADKIGVSLKSVQKSLKRSRTPIRKAAKRDQHGAKNSSWAGESVTYKGGHCRVRLHRGKPEKCEKCGVDNKSAKLEWANVSGKYHDPNDYIPLCIPCHRKWDNERRKANVVG